MKITRNNLRKLILREVSSYQVSRYDEASGNIKIIAELIMAGMATLSGQNISSEDRYEYGEDVIHLLSKYVEPEGIQGIVDVFMEIRSGGGSSEDPSRTISFTNPTTGEAESHTGVTEDEVDEILDAMFRAHGQDIKYSVD